MGVNSVDTTARTTHDEFPSVVMASEDDVYVTLEQAAAYAAAWGSRLVNIGRAGHINSASGLGAWPAGYALLEALRSGHQP